jgi:hypothetical protein
MKLCPNSVLVPSFPRVSFLAQPFRNAALEQLLPALHYQQRRVFQTHPPVLFVNTKICTAFRDTIRSTRQ